MTREEAREVLGDVRAYLASRASLENEMLAGHTFTDICNAIKALEFAEWVAEEIFSEDWDWEHKIPFKVDFIGCDEEELQQIDYEDYE